MANGFHKGYVGLLILLILLCTASAALWLKSANSDDVGSGRYRRQGYLRVGYAVEAPYAFMEGGRVTGAGPEEARLVAARLGIPEVRWHVGEFSSLLDMLEADEVDLVAAGMFITPEREKRVRFSAPTAQVLRGLLVRRDAARMPGSYAGLAGAGTLRVAVLEGAVEAKELLAAGVPESRLLLVPDASTGRAAVMGGEVDALALSLPTVRWLAREAESLFPATPLEAVPLETPDPAMVGYAFGRENGALVEAWDAALARVIASPEGDELAVRFGMTRPGRPGS